MIKRSKWAAGIIWVAILSVALAPSKPIHAQATFDAPAGAFGEEQILEVDTAWSHSGVRPGGSITLALILDIRPPYHINPNITDDDNFIATKVEIVEAPDTLRASTPIFPEPEEIPFGFEGAKQMIKVFSNRTVIFIPMAVTGSATPGEKAIQIRIDYQACNDTVCLQPTSTTTTATLPILPEGADIAELNPELFATLKEFREKLDLAFFGWDFTIEPANLWILLLVAALGGFLLNLTPCVLPVIPIKIIGLSRAAGNRQRCFLLGLTMSIGVVAFWLGLGVAISTVSGFGATNQLFQYPAFTITVGFIIVTMAIGMCGLFTVNLPTWIYRFNPSHESFGGSFFFGIMTAILSTPCTAPFMGAAAAWSATQNPGITLATFAAIGGGMALPYLLLSAFPALVSRMPRAGAASELIKQVMGLLLLAAGTYFIGTGAAGLLATPPDPPSDAYWWAVGFFVAAAGVWLAWRTWKIAKHFRNKLVYGTLGLALVAGGAAIAWRFTQTSPIQWIYYTPDRFAQAMQEKKVVVLEFTAAWCLNCHALEQAVLHDPEVVAALNAPDVAPIKVDITGNNPSGNQKLVELGRRTIPYLVIYAQDGEQIFSSDAYTVDQVTAAIEKARTDVAKPVAELKSGS